MHSVDPTTEQMIRSVLAYAENRLRLDPVPLDGGRADPAQFDAVLHGLPGEEPHNADQVLGAYASVLAPAVISADSPRFLGFIPAAPTKASLLFDMLVSCASIQGISWLEASGAIHAENLVLRLIADRAGLPASAGGCFVSGGSAANLSALVVAREIGQAQAPGDRRRAGRRWRVAADRRPLLDRQHAADPGDGPADRAHRRPPADRRRPSAPPSRPTATRPRSPPWSPPPAPPTPGSSTTWPALGRRRRASTACGSTWTAPTAARACSPPASGDRYDGIEHADSFVVDPHKWLFAPFDCAALLYRDPALARSVHKQDAVLPRRDPRRSPTSWNPTDYAYHLTRRARGLPLWFSLSVHGVRAYTQRDRGGDPAGRAGRRGDRHPRLPGADPRARPRRRAVPPPRLGAGALHAWADQLLRRPGGVHSAPSAWEGETVARFAFLHPHTSMDLVRQILDRMAAEARALALGHKPRPTAHGAALSRCQSPAGEPEWRPASGGRLAGR